MVFTPMLVAGCKKQIDHAQFELVDKIEIDREFVHPFWFFTSKENLQFAFNEEKKPLFQFKNEVDYSKYDFVNYDYIFTFGRERSELSYSDDITSQIDGCPYLKKIPLLADYKSDSPGDIIYVYKISSKHKFRSPCP